MDKLERVARAIAQDGFGRNWDDFLPVNAHDTDQGDLMEYAQAAIAALEPVNKPRVKPLEWEDRPADDGPVMSKAVAINGTYFIVDDTDDFSGLYLELISHDNAKWWQHVRSKCDVLLEGIHSDDLEPIKAAAQADYEARILAALEPVTVRRCQKCGAPEDNHPYRHPFVSIENPAD